MAANEYYSPAPSPGNGRRYDARPPRLPLDPYATYSSHPTQPSPQPSPPQISSPYEDTRYRPYADQSQQSIPSPYYASGAGGRETEPNPYADDIPLRQHPSKRNSEILHDPLPHDPAIIDRPAQNAVRRRKQGFLGGGKIPWIVYTLTLIQVSVFIAELVKNGEFDPSDASSSHLMCSGVLTKTPIEVHPSFNPMIGPSPYVLINMGARYVPCMRQTSEGLDTTIDWPCPNTTSTSLDDTSNQCQLNSLCGFHDKVYTTSNPPNQWFRFIIPMFLHAGFIHIAFNMLLQILLGKEIEILIGSIRFLIIYLSSGIFGFILGGNFAPQGIASTGASGSLFGIIAIMLLDLLYHWGERRSPWGDLAWLVFDIVISFALGLLPGLDNFSHIGGFLMGLVLGICLIHSPEILRQRIREDLPPYASVQQARRLADNGDIKTFVKEPVAFVKGRKPLWWTWWLVRAAALIGAFVVFTVLLKNFYKADPKTCHWCRYLSCIVSPKYLMTVVTTSKADCRTLRIGVILAIYRRQTARPAASGIFSADRWRLTWGSSSEVSYMGNGSRGCEAAHPWLGFDESIARTVMHWRGVGLFMEHYATAS